MSKPIWTSCSFALSFIFFVELAIFDACGQSRLVLQPTQDATVNRQYSDKNFGSATELEIKRSKSERKHKRCYLRFDLQKVENPISLAVLECSITKGSPTVAGQQERVHHFENFALNMLGTPHCVGLHWFRFVDDDGSNKGVYDEHFNPYQELQDSVRNISRQMYRLRSRQLFGNLDFNGSVK